MQFKFASKKLYASTVLCKNWIIYVVYINNLYCECFEIKKIIVLYLKKYCYQWLSEYEVSSDIAWTCPVYLMRFKIKHNYCTNCAPLITHSAFPFPSFPHPTVHAIITEFPIFLDCQTCIKQPVQFFRKKYLFCILEIIVTVIFYIARSPKSATMPTLEFSNWETEDSSCEFDSSSFLLSSLLFFFSFLASSFLFLLLKCVLVNPCWFFDLSTTLGLAPWCSYALVNFCSFWDRDLQEPWTVSLVMPLDEFEKASISLVVLVSDNFMSSLEEQPQVPTPGLVWSFSLKSIFMWFFFIVCVSASIVKEHSIPCSWLFTDSLLAADLSWDKYPETNKHNY